MLFNNNDKIFDAMIVRKILLKIVILARFMLEISRILIEYTIACVNTPRIAVDTTPIDNWYNFPSWSLNTVAIEIIEKVKITAKDNSDLVKLIKEIKREFKVSNIEKISMTHY